MRGINEQKSIVVCEYRLRLVEGDAVLALVQPSVAGIPLDAELFHASVYISCAYKATSPPLTA